MDILFDKKTTQLVYLLTLTFPILGSSDISRDSLLKKKTAAQIVYLNKHKQTYNYEQQFSISCVGSIHPQMYS